MMLIIYQFIFLCSIVIQVQCTIGNGYAGSSVARDQELMRVLSLKQRKPLSSPTTSSTSASYILKPNSTPDSILPLPSYISHTYGSFVAGSGSYPTTSPTSVSYILKPNSTPDSILPLSSYISHTFGSSALGSGPSSSASVVGSIHSSSAVPSVTVNSLTSSNTVSVAGNKPSGIVSAAGSAPSVNANTANNNPPVVGIVHATQLDSNQLPLPSVHIPNNATHNVTLVASGIIASAINNTPRINITPLQQLNSSTVSVINITALMINGTLPPNVIVNIQEIVDDEAHIKPCYRKGKKVEFSQYWIPKENEWDETNNGKRVYLGGNEKMKLFDKNNKELGMVPVDMYNKCKMEGTCLLENGDLINIDNSTNSFIRVGGKDREHNVFGLGSGLQNLVPFVSVAANDIPYGQTLYIEQLDGLDLGGNQKHNGCVRVDDDSWSFDSCQIDFFVLSYVDYLWLNLDEKVSIKYSDCKVKNYISKHHLAIVKATSNEKIIPSLLEAKYVP